LEVQMFRKSSVLVVILALSATLALTLAGCGGGAGSESNTETGSAETQSTTEGTAAPEMGGEGVGTEAGMMPPTFTLPDLDGADVTLSDYRGKVVVLDLWATWCPPCREEIPFLVELYEDLKNEGLVVVGVGLDQGGRNTLAPFVDENGITYPILVGNREVQAAYGVTGIPTTFLIGRDGKISAKHVGYHPSMAESFRAEVKALLEAQAEA
jgi:peroxiredoxin